MIAPQITGLTPKQAQLLDFLGAFTRGKGYAPSYEECLVALGLKSKSNIHRLVTGLEQRGFLRREHKLRRSIALTGHRCPSCQQPVQTPPQNFTVAKRIRVARLSAVAAAEAIL